MTLFSTITYGRPAVSTLARPFVAFSIVLALALGVGVGFLISSVDTTSQTQEALKASALSHEQFLRVNTTELASLVGSTSDDPFLVRNVDSFQGLQPVEALHTVDSHFFEINGVAAQAASAGAAPQRSAAPIVGDTEPFGHPNYGRLETYLGAEPTGGIR